MKQYFTIDELCASSKAKTFKIDNTPTNEIKSRLNELIDFLNPIREAWGSAIKVTSGYRNAKVNKLVNGSKTSAHMLGYAADLYPDNGKFDEFKVFIKNYLNDKLFDQCIIEKSGYSRWIHIGLYNNKHQQRKMIFNIDK